MRRLGHHRQDRDAGYPIYLLGVKAGTLLTIGNILVADLQDARIHSQRLFETSCSRIRVALTFDLPEAFALHLS